METFSFNTSINLSSVKCLLAVSSSEETNYVFNITDSNNSFSLTIPVHWSSRGGAETVNNLKNLELRSINDIELDVKEFEKRGLKIIKEFFLSDLDTHKNETKKIKKT